MADIQITWNGKEITEDVKKGLVIGLKSAAEFILDESNKQVPIDEATLKNSGSTGVDEVNLEASVTYDTPYAVRQHEDTTLKHTNGKKAKFLEDAIKENMRDVEKYLADAVANALR